MTIAQRRALRVAAALRSAAFGLVLSAAPVLAQQDLRQDDWAFNLFNDSGIALSAFQTADKGGNFGHNWLAEPMAPGHGLTLEFTDPLDTRCEVPVRISYPNGATLDSVVDFCGIAILRLTNEGLFIE